MFYQYQFDVLAQEMEEETKQIREKLENVPGMTEEKIERASKLNRIITLKNAQLTNAFKNMLIEYGMLNTAMKEGETDV